MISYSQILSRRARYLGLLLLAGLLAAAWWQHRHVPQEEATIFRPESRIGQVWTVVQLLQSPGAASTASTAVGAALPCEGRALRVLQARLVASLALDEAQALERLKQAAQQTRWADCAGFTSAWITALRLNRQEGLSLTPQTVAQAMTEDVSWGRKVPCLLAGSPQAPLLVSGLALECGLDRRFQTLASLPRESSFRKQVTPLAQTAVTASMSGRWRPESAQWLSLQAPLQARLDRWQACLASGSCPGAPELTALKNLSLVVLDTSDGRVLATWCTGPACERARQQGPGVLPATLMEAPPASTAKLLFSLALAQEPSTRGMLERQIKTSGQVDASVSKRNEWWEKQAICDGRQGACSLPEETGRISAALGLNAHCQEDSGSACGRWGLLVPEQYSLLPGQMGRLVLPPPRPKPATMLDWKTYDDIRLGRRKPAPSPSYERTALTVQAVIGGGDSRTSALGVATVPLQLWRLAQDLPPLVPTVLQPLQAGTALAATPRAWREPAQVVLQGMRKVVEPEERGWQGPGTAAGAVQRVMGRACQGDCGLWAKTGTVSRQDKVFGGTTLLSALVDTEAWSQWLGAPVLPGYEKRVLALGVIAMPGAKPPEGHAASLLGMQALRLMLLEEPPP